MAGAWNGVSWLVIWVVHARAHDRDLESPTRQELVPLRSKAIASEYHFLALVRHYMCSPAGVVW
jgi:hypothetical protein